MITNETAQIDIVRKYHEILKQNRRQQDSINEIHLSVKIAVALLTNISMELETPEKKKSFLKFVTRKVKENLERPDAMTVAKVYID